MKPALLLVLTSFSTLTVASHDIVPERRLNSTCDPNGWVQKPSGHATFTSIHTCVTPCKRFAYFCVLAVLHRSHAEHDILLQHAA